MLPLLADYLDHLEELHTDIQHTLAGLSKEALDWSPGPDMNSLAVLAAHTAGALRYWLGDIVGQAPSGRDRDAEFRTKDLDAAALIARLDAALAHSRDVLDKLTLADLESNRTLPRDGTERGVVWALAYALAHTANHLGHMQIVRQLWDMANHQDTTPPG